MAADERELSRIRNFSSAEFDDEEEFQPPKLSFIEKLRLRREEYIEKLNFYSTIFFSLLAIGAFFVFLFLVPFVIEPAITTMQMNFQLRPVRCCVVSFSVQTGADNCGVWSSCREGCTREVYQCAQIEVAYTTTTNVTCSQQQLDSADIWMFRGARLFPNVKGCGYPPTLNCSQFADTYGNTSDAFDCYFSGEDAALVITSLDPAQLRRGLVVSITVPFACLIVSVLFLVHAYLRMRRKQAVAAAAAADVTAETLAAAVDEVMEGDTHSVTGHDLTMPCCSRPPSSYSLRSLGSRINSSVVRFARDRHSNNGDEDQIELQTMEACEIDSRYLEPGRLPSGNQRHLLPPLTTISSEVTHRSGVEDIRQ